MGKLYSAVRKLRRIAQSELAGLYKLRYALKAGGRDTGIITYGLRGGHSVVLRRESTDFKVFDEIFVERAYAPCVAGLPDNLGPVTLIDLGANIGLSVLFLARALEVIEIIAVEPDPDNFRLLSENLRRTGLASRTTALRVFAGAGRGFAELYDSGNGAWGRRMGTLSYTGTPVLPLVEIAGVAKTSARLILKCDIEGGERQLLLQIRDWEHLIPYILLELHTEFLSVQEMFTCLESSAYQWTIHGTPDASDVIVLLMLERGLRRS